MLASPPYFANPTFAINSLSPKEEDLFSASL
jgi:hypothetical protein